MTDDLYFLELAFLEAKKAQEHDEVPVGAVIVEEGRVIASSFNQKEQRQDVLAHAEILCIQKVAKQRRSWRLYGCTLYTTLEPCILCASAIIHSRIDKVIYGALDQKGGGESLFKLFSSNKCNHYVDSQYLEHSESSAILKKFFASKRSKA